MFEGRFSSPDFEYLGVRWGRAEWTGVADPFRVHFDSLVLRRPGGELRLSGETESGAYGGRDALDIRARFSAWPAADFIKAGSMALGVGADLVDLQAIREGKASVITERAREYVRIVKEARASG